MKKYCFINIGLKGLTITICLLSAILAMADNPKSKIEEALEYQIANYPYSQYCDVYKNFMQDYFGPGHILADTVAAGKYLRRELSETVLFEGPDYEPTGFNGNFYRVNLRVVADGSIPYEKFFDAFVRSVQDITPPPAEEWMATWHLIDGVIKESGIHFDNEEAERAQLEKQFSEGNFVVHHSRTFDDNSNFHYRIIDKEIFAKEILPFI